MAGDGVSFAVPFDSVYKIIQHFKKSGYVLIFLHGTTYFKYKIRYLIGNLVCSLNMEQFIYCQILYLE